MDHTRHLNGVIAAIVTPLKDDFSPDLDGLVTLIHFLAGRGCHGILLMGTTGEGPSFSLEERTMIYRAAVSCRQDLPNFQFFGGTGTPSLEDTAYLTKSIFDLGFDAAVILPPYYFRKASDDGLFAWFSHVLDKSVPSGGAVLGYHIPNVSGVSLGLDLLSRLRDAFPTKFLGLKDSTGDPQLAQTLGSRFGKDLLVFTGNDRLFTLALKSHAAGCITAIANIFSPLHRMVWDKFQAGIEDGLSQQKLTHLREFLDQYPPMPPLLKLVLSKKHGFPLWKVKPPLLECPADIEAIILPELMAVEDHLQ